MAALKIKAEHYAKLEAACKAVLEAHPGIYEDYQQAGHSNMRFNWDVLHTAKIDGVRGMKWICDNLYPYINDIHIGSALRQILGNDGLDRNGRK